MWPRWAWWLVVLLVAAPRVGWAQVEWLRVGDVVAGWRVAAIDQRPDAVRLELTADDGRTTLEIRRHDGGEDPLATGQHRLSAPLGAPGVPPPKALMDAVLDELRAYDDAGGGPLCSGEPAQPAESGPTAPGPSRTTRTDASRDPPTAPQEPPSQLTNDKLGFEWEAAGLPGQWPWTLLQRYPTRGWPWICLLLGAATIALRRRAPWRKWLERSYGFVERQPWPWLAALLVGMAALRLAHLDVPFTFDALAQRLFFGSLDLGDIIAHRYADQRHPQLYYLILHGFLWFGHGEAVARLPAVLFSLAAAVTLFVLVRPALGAVGALATTALLGLNVSFLTFSREVGDLTLFTFLVLLSTLLLLRALAKPKRSTIIAFAVVEAAMFYAYYLAVLVVCVHAAVVLVRGRTTKHRGLWLGLAGALLVALPSLVDLAALVSTDRGIRDVARAFPKHVWGERSIVELWAQLGAHLAPSAEMLLVMTMLAMAGVFRLARRPWRSPLVLVSTLSAAVATLVVGLAVPLVRLKPYYLLFILPFVLLLVVAGCLGRRPVQTAGATRTPGGKTPWRAELRAGSAVGLMALLIGGHAADLSWRLAVTYVPNNPPQYRALGERIQREPGPRIVIADPNALHTILVYYAFPDPLGMYRTCVLPPDGGGTACHRGDEHLVTLTALPTMTAGWDQRSANRFAQARQLGPSWVVYSTYFKNERLLDELREECALEGKFGDYGNLSLYRCPAKATAP